MASELARAWRSLLPAVPQDADARVELLALVWGPRVDLQHALQLAERLPRAPLADLRAAADRFDALDARRQQRLRRMLVPEGCATMGGHAPHPAH